MMLRSLTAIVLCTAGLTMLAVPGAMADPNGHANSHAQGAGGGGNGNGNGQGSGGGSSSATPQSAVRQYVLANGLKQGDVAKALKSWNSLNANPKAFLNNLNNPNSLLGREAQYICSNAQAQTALSNFVSLGGNPASPPTAQDAANAQAYLDALTLLGTLDPATVVASPTSYSTAQVDAAKLVLASSLTKTSAQAVIDQYAAWTVAQTAAQQASASFAAATNGNRSAAALAALRQTVDGVIAQKGFDTATLCATSTASAQ